MKITNDKGLSFNIRVVKVGDSYGLDRCLTHKRDPKARPGSLAERAEPMIEFYDAELQGDARFDPEGQFVARYYVSSLALIKADGVGLDLQGDVPEWKIDGKALAPVLDLARALLEGRA